MRVPTSVCMWPEEQSPFVFSTEHLWIHVACSDSSALSASRGFLSWNWSPFPGNTTCPFWFSPLGLSEQVLFIFYKTAHHLSVHGDSARTGRLPVSLSTPAAAPPHFPAFAHTRPVPWFTNIPLKAHCPGPSGGAEQCNRHLLLPPLSPSQVGTTLSSSSVVPRPLLLTAADPASPQLSPVWMLTHLSISGHVWFCV